MPKRKTLIRNRHRYWLDRHRDDIRPNIRKLALRKARIPWSVYQKMSMNSFEREAIIPRLTDEALVLAAESCLANCSSDAHRPPISYNDAFLGTYAPLLLKRLRRHIRPD